MSKADYPVITINGHSYTATQDKVVMGVMLTHMVPRINFYSADAIIQIYREAVALMEEQGVKIHQKARLLKMMDKMESRLKDAEFERTRPDKDPNYNYDFDYKHIHDGLCTMVVNTVLAAEGCGLLPGFGHCTFETTEGRRKVTAAFMSNAEKTSVTG